MVTPLLTAALTLAELAPFISRWFTKDAEKLGLSKQVGEKIVDIAKQVTGTDDPLKAVKQLERNPASLLRYQQEVLKLDRETEIAFLRDRQSARQRDIAYITSGKHNLRADLMVIAAALGLMSCLGALAYFKQWLPGEAVGIISTVAGIFGSCLKDAYTFEFGSSRGSKVKDATLFLRGM